MAVTDRSNDGSEYDLSHGSVIVDDTLTVLPQLPENEFHAIVCDPPYNFDGGFMQQQWDDIGTAKEYQQWCEDWANKALHTLRPGGHLIAFSGNRSHHRLMSGVEDAGYEIRDTITWHYGEGMPKGARLSTWLDDEHVDQWGDWRANLKPATEFAVLARSPLGESSATRNQVEWGVGNLNVESCRIGYVSESDKPRSQKQHDIRNGGVDEGNRLNPSASGRETEYLEDEVYEADDDGRFPANLALDPVMAEVMDLQSGERQGCSPHTIDDSGSRDVLDDGGLGETGPRLEGYDDSGGASRFFYCAKPSKSEKTHDGEVENDHSTVKPIDLMEWLIKMVTADGQRVLDPFLGSGTTMLAADNVSRECVGIERDDEYAEIARRRWDVHACN